MHRLSDIAKNTEERFQSIRHHSEPNFDIIYSAGSKHEASNVLARLRTDRTDRRIPGGKVPIISTYDK